MLSRRDGTTGAYESYFHLVDISGKTDTKWKGIGMHGKIKDSSRDDDETE